MQADKVMYNTSEVLFRHRANTNPQRDSLFTKGPSDVLDHVTSGTASGSKRGIDATKNLRAIICNNPGRRWSN
jgi:4-hydroxy-3-polyprenylbenzoate decarboxylase